MTANYRYSYIAVLYPSITQKKTTAVISLKELKKCPLRIHLAESTHVFNRPRSNVLHRALKCSAPPYNLDLPVIHMGRVEKQK